MNSREEPSGAVSLPLVWQSPEETAIQFVNQVVIQAQGDEFILMFGQQAPPLTFGSPEERADQASRLGYVPVRVAARLGMPRKRFKEFANLVARMLVEYGQREEEQQSG
jgi:hypothetical protein